MRVITFTASVFQSWLYTFWSWQNDQHRVEMLKAHYPIPNESVTTWNFMNWWWTSYEMIILSNIQYQPETSASYCRIQPDIPTSFATASHDDESINHRWLSKTYLTKFANMYKIATNVARQKINVIP